MNSERHSTQINQVVLTIWSQIFIGYYLNWRSVEARRDYLMRLFVRRLSAQPSLQASGTAGPKAQLSYFFSTIFQSRERAAGSDVEPFRSKELS
jgi:hypothetical protein